MSREEAARAVLAGAGIVEELVESGGVDLLVTGDMGIGNTTPAACLVSAFTGRPPADRKSTRLNSSHANISYAVFCLKKKKFESIGSIENGSNEERSEEHTS